MKILKKNYKLLIGFILGLVVAGTSVYAATVISSKDISYDNTSSKLSSTNVKDALDELSTKTELKNRDNIVEGYTYNQTSGASNYCVTGEESTCVKTTCYKSTTANSCKAGDIIKYKVNDTDIVTFHVMYDNGTTMTMQTQKNTISNTMWYGDNINTYGPTVILPVLEHVTNGWTNVNYIEYTAGTTVLYQNAYTGCNAYNSCTTNRYTLPSHKARARMITSLETVALGCTNQEKTCPKWIYNYLAESTSYGGTVNDSTIDTTTGQQNSGYFTMSAGTITSSTGDSNYVLAIYQLGLVSFQYPMTTAYGARAVVVINK